MVVKLTQGLRIKWQQICSKAAMTNGKKHEEGFVDLFRHLVEKL
jgi:hypothetical protein